MKPSELYKRTPVKTTNTLWELEAHIPELLDACYTVIDGENPRIEICYFKDHCYDRERVWTLAGVKYCGEYVMVIQNAGRGGDDHQDRFITDYPKYQSMVKYIRELIGEHDIPDDLCDPEADIPQLTEFYNQELDGVFKHY